MSDALFAALQALPVGRPYGRIKQLTDVAVEAVGPKVRMGELCALALPDGGQLWAQVVAVHESGMTLLPYGASQGLSVGDAVHPMGHGPMIPVGDALLGRVLDPWGHPLDGKAAPQDTHLVSLQPAPINPHERAAVRKLLPTGVRAIDALLPMGQGQRMGIFAGSGVGKTTLLHMLARDVQADVTVVALVGERGREAAEFIQAVQQTPAGARTVLVVATAEQPALVRAQAIPAATAMAEHFRAQGRSVFLLVDSITRFAMARREVDLAAGLPPTARGYTPTVFSAIPALCERCGPLKSGGAITALYTVLVEGDDVNDPVADTLRATLDGHIVLHRELANDGHFPAIDIGASVSRLDSTLLAPPQLAAARRCRQLLTLHRRQRDMVDMGLYKSGSNPDLDEALGKWTELQNFLKQAPQEREDAQRSHHTLQSLMARRLNP